MMRSDFAIDSADGATCAGVTTRCEIKVDVHICLYSTVERYESQIYFAKPFRWDGVGYDIVARIFVHREGEISSFSSFIVMWDFNSNSEAILYGPALCAEYQITLRICDHMG
jgi:hypothetical protein